MEGTGSSGVLLVGEASGELEARDQLPFRPYAPAGSVLERVIRRMGLAREMFSITNTLRCRPRNNWLEKSPWEYGALTHCRPNLDAVIAERRPRCIVALGATATRELTGMAGEAQGVGHLHGYVLPHAREVNVRCDECISFSDNKPDPNCFICGGTGWVSGGPKSQVGAIPVVPAFHPAYLRRGKASHQGVFARALQRAMNVAAGRDREYLWGVVPEDRSTHGGLEYITHPTTDDARGFAGLVARNAGATLSYDLETAESASLDEDARDGFADTRIELIQFALESGRAIAMPWTGCFREIARDVLQSPNTKCGHNVWLFDNKVLRAAGLREGLDLTPKGVVHDTLQMFHHWQPDLPAHLQFAASFVRFPFPWKHLAATDIEFYGCCDVDATLRLYTFLEATLRKDGLWDDGVAA